ncbi:hypothetical protein BC332_12659 [Capsicum chinense]|nr:hypothetical protein BC332_12659 [Capsicum chinense]
MCHSRKNRNNRRCYLRELDGRERCGVGLCCSNNAGCCKNGSIDVEQETEKWRKVIILYVVGDSPTIGALERFIASQWNFAAKPKIYYHNEGFFVVLFKSMEYWDAVLASGHHTLNN